MFDLKFITKRKWVLTGVILLLIFMVATPQALTADVCEKALEKCIINAALAGLFSLSPAVFTYFSTSCLMGYSFCISYYSVI
jgi:hypothetical protein